MAIITIGLRGNFRPPPPSPMCHLVTVALTPTLSYPRCDVTFLTHQKQTFNKFYFSIQKHFKNGKKC